MIKYYVIRTKFISHKKEKKRTKFITNTVNGCFRVIVNKLF